MTMKIRVTLITEKFPQSICQNWEFDISISIYISKTTLEFRVWNRNVVCV